MTLGSADMDWNRRHLWHPYDSMSNPAGCRGVESALGCSLTLSDGRCVIDGMSSWWTAVYGYGHPRLVEAGRRQMDKLSHVMFGGLTHEAAVRLGRQLLAIAPAGLEHLFFCDSGSVAVEVAIKMAMQYYLAADCPAKRKLLALRGAYHGDTFGAMSLCDPDQGMHAMWSGRLAENIFTDRPAIAYGADWDSASMTDLRHLISENHRHLAAVIVEPVVQGAGGMWFYHPQYLRELRQLCDRYDILLIADEIATGFSRSGKMWGCDHAGISPDILCAGKALTGGMLSLAVTMASARVAHGISAQGGVLMHGPTFMANPLACAIASESLAMIEEMDISATVGHVESVLSEELSICRNYPHVADVRVLGAIGVVELDCAIDIESTQAALLDRGLWLRPFGRLLYTMPPYIISDDELGILCRAMADILRKDIPAGREIL